MIKSAGWSGSRGSRWLCWISNALATGHVAGSIFSSRVKARSRWYGALWTRSSSAVIYALMKPVAARPVPAQISTTYRSSHGGNDHTSSTTIDSAVFGINVLSPRCWPAQSGDSGKGFRDDPRTVSSEPSTEEAISESASASYECVRLVLGCLSLTEVVAAEGVI
jgi:hypothetical protein